MGDIYFPHLGIKIEELSRTAFKIGDFNIYWYGIFIALGALLGIVLCLKEAERTGQSQDIYSDFAFIAIISGICGARIYYLVFHGDSILNFFKFREGGLAIYGGVIGGAIAAIVYSKAKKINFFKLADTCIMSVLVGQIFGRWGNFFNMEAFGRYTDSLFAMALKAEKVSGLVVKGETALYQGNAEYPITVFNGVNYIQVHPTFLYECVWNICLFLLIFSFRKHKKFEGQLMSMYFVGYGVGRFFIESLRTDQLKVFGVPVSMLVSGALVIMGAVFTLVSLKFVKNNNTEV
ncbi:MAG: prolipoprotein diacylglyceryl transferase [Clostridia bacterium]|nr:prolipoprotein diacylglyceryl transferase [Clostridia bacterium]